MAVCHALVDLTYPQVVGPLLQSLIIHSHFGYLLLHSFSKYHEGVKLIGPRNVGDG